MYNLILVQGEPHKYECEMLISDTKEGSKTQLGRKRTEYIFSIRDTHANQ
jgi:hypothetical protein